MCRWSRRRSRAKAIATIDHITHGRAGLNIVCGWNQEEFDLHGVTIDQARRYDHGLEWFRIWSRLLRGGPEFDWDGEFFHLRRLADRSRLDATAMAGGDVGGVLAEGAATSPHKRPTCCSPHMSELDQGP